MTELRIEKYTLPGVRLDEENPLPFFRDPAVSLQFKMKEGAPPEKLAYFGWETAFRVLPYRMQDQYTRNKRPVDFQAAVLENEYLKATFLPEIGGRLVSLVYKPEERELLHRNPVFQPANLAIRNAWFSGGIEWNIGQLGHTFFTCAPLYAAAIQGAQGEPGLRMYEFERCKRLFWHMDFYLPPGSKQLIAYFRVINPNDEPTSMYWWTNIAVNEREGVRVLAPADTSIYGDFSGGEASFGVSSMPNLPSIQGADGSYSLNFPFANEFFFQCDSTSTPWEAALDKQGTGFFEVSTQRLKYRKMFCWGTHAGGRHWQEFLAQPGEAYIEIQGGLAPTQVHGLPMPSSTTWDWTQAFGYVEADPKRVHGSDWQDAVDAVEKAFQADLSVEQLYQVEEQCRKLAEHPSQVILQAGSGWGALELARRAQDPNAMQLPETFVFPAFSLGTEQQKWLALLEQGVLPAQDPNHLPGEWMVQPEWEGRLEKSVKSEAGCNWYALLHLGVMRLEHFDETGAEEAWLESIRLRPTVWAYRNLAVLSLRQKKETQAFAYYDKAWELAVAGGALPSALVVEFLQTLVETGQFERGMAAYQALPPAVQQTDRVQILRGQFALATGDLQAVEEVLQREYAVIREGETVLTDLWFEMQARRESARTGRPLDDNLRREVKALYPPPSGFDFRMSAERG